MFKSAKLTFKTANFTICKVFFTTDISSVYHSFNSNTSLLLGLRMRNHSGVLTMQLCKPG